MSRPTDEELEDFCETGYMGCLLPDHDDIPQGPSEPCEDDD